MRYCLDLRLISTAAKWDILCLAAFSIAIFSDSFPLFDLISAKTRESKHVLIYQICSENSLLLLNHDKRDLSFCFGQPCMNSVNMLLSEIANAI